MTSLDPAVTAADLPVPQWRGVNHLALLTAVREADLVVLNLECCISERGERAKEAMVALSR